MTAIEPSSAKTEETDGSTNAETPYWVFVCNPAKWAIDRFLEQGIETDTWGVRPSDKEKFAPGQLGIVRVGVDRRNAAERAGKPRLEPGIYALCEIESTVFPASGAGDLFWAEDEGREEGWPTVRIRYLRTFSQNPLTIETLRQQQPGISHLVLDGFQAASFPISGRDFRIILEMLDVDVETLAQEGTASADTMERLAELERRYADASPEVKERTSRYIERGPIGAAVKKANGHKCQVCEALGLASIGFRKSNGDPYVEAHHVMPVARKEAGSLSAANIMTVCANHHRQLHYGHGVSVTANTDAFSLSIDGRRIEIPKTMVKPRAELADS